MNSFQQRALLFLIGCVGVRVALALFAKNGASPRQLYWMGIIAILPAIGFMYMYTTGIRKTGMEVAGDKIWWNELRPFHSLMYFAFAYYAIYGHTKIAWKFLAADVAVGLAAFLWTHWRNGNLRKLVSI